MLLYFFFFFFQSSLAAEIYTLSLHDALPICPKSTSTMRFSFVQWKMFDGLMSRWTTPCRQASSTGTRSEEHTSELQSQSNLVCRLLLEKKNKLKIISSMAISVLTYSSSRPAT